EVPWIPEIGLELASATPLERLTWLGEGPLDSLPNKHAATWFGQWSAAIGEPAAEGTKSGLEWACWTYAGGNQALEVRGAAGVRVVRTDAGPAMRVLTNLAGAWTKNGPPERPEWQLNLETTKSFEGGFELVPIASVQR